MDDIWASTNLSPTITGRLPGEKLIEVADTVGGGLYYLDNGHFLLPDGHGLRVKYLNPRGRMTEVFRVYDLPGDTATWQQKAVEPAINIINRRQRRMERLGFGKLKPRK